MTMKPNIPSVPTKEEPSVLEETAAMITILRQETHHVSRTVEDVGAELMGLVGRELD